MMRWVVVLAVLVAAVTALIVWAVCWWNTKPIISVNYMALHNEKRKPANYDPNEDGAILWEQAMAILGKTGGIRKVKPGETLNPELHGEGAVGVTADWPSELDSTELANVKGWLERNANALQLMKQAQEKKLYWFKIPDERTPIWKVGFARSYALASALYGLIWRGKIKAVEGNIRSGMEDIFTAATFGKCFGERPAPIEQMMKMSFVGAGYGAATQVLSRLTLSGDELAWVASRVEEISSVPLNYNGELLADDYLARDVVQRFFSDDGHGDGRLLARCVCEDAADDNTFFNYPWSREGERSTGVKAAVSAIKLTLRTESRKATLARMQKLREMRIRLCAITPYEPEFGRLKGEYERCWLGNPFLQVCWFGTDAAVNEAQRHQRYGNHGPGLLTVIAILRYKAEKGKPPETLGSLVEEGYLKELAVDRFTGEPFIYRATGDDFTLYSTGDNAKDDGGTRKGRLDEVYWPVEVHPGK